MQNEPTEERLRSLECDRLMAAGLCMAAVTIAVTRFATKMPAAAGLFEPLGAGPVLAPVFALGALLIGAIAQLIAAGTNRRLYAGIIVAAGSASVALAAPLLHLSMATFVASATPAWTAATVAFIAFGLYASVAIQELKPAWKHTTFSAAITVFALFQAAVDGSGVFAVVLAIMGMVFFTRWRPPAKT